MSPARESHRFDSFDQHSWFAWYGFGTVKPKVGLVGVCRSRGGPENLQRKPRVGRRAVLRTVECERYVNHHHLRWRLPRASSPPSLTQVAMSHRRRRRTSPQIVRFQEKSRWWRAPMWRCVFSIANNHWRRFRIVAITRRGGSERKGLREVAFFVKNRIAAKAWVCEVANHWFVKNLI